MPCSHFTLKKISNDLFRRGFTCYERWTITFKTLVFVQWASAAGDKLSTEQTKKVSDSKRCRTVGSAGHGFWPPYPSYNWHLDSAAKDWMNIEFLFETPQSSLSSAVDITSACSPSAIAFPPSYDEILYHDTPLAAKGQGDFGSFAPSRCHPVRS